MPIFDPKCFTVSYLQEMQRTTRAQDILMLERCVLALELVGRLKQHGLDFIFKGGTSLLLQLPEPRRLSIDVDILCQEKGKLPEVLDKVVREMPFTGWEPQTHRDRDEPPTTHYAVSFQSVVGPPDADLAVIIDLIEGKNPYADLAERELNTAFIEPLESVRLTLPSINSMLGDKLAAFAPGTIGYPYQPWNRRGEPDVPRPANVVKHLFDLGQLALYGDNLEHAIRSYRNIHREQCHWRGSHDLSACLEDTQSAAAMAAQVEALNQPAANERIDFFRRGINSVASHMFAEPFGREAARIASGRAALVAEIVRGDKADFQLASVLAEEPDIPYLKQARLSGDWAILEKLKRTDINAYAVWEQAQRLRG